MSKNPADRSDDYTDIIEFLNNLDADECISNVIIASHGGPHSMSDCGITDKTILYADSDVSVFFAALSRHACDDAVIDFRACRVARDSSGQDFLQACADLSNCSCTGIDQFYAIVPHGTRYTARPGGKTAEPTRKYHQYNGSIGQWLNNGGPLTTPHCPPAK